MHSNDGWQGTPISVVSLGIGDISALSTNARTSIIEAEVIIGADHHFDEITDLAPTALCVRYPSPFNQLKVMLEKYADRKITILASGDALFFGVGRLLCNIVGRQSLRFYASISSVQACFHEIGLPWQDARVVSVHGRPTAVLRRELVPNTLLAVLTDSLSSPQVIAAEVNNAGFYGACIWVCEAMGGQQQCIRQYSVEGLMNEENTFHSLNVCILQLGSSAHCNSAFPGIADHLFETGSRPGFGMISKREVRMTILSCMQPLPGEIAWDIGAGCGSVSVEWARWNPRGKIYAIESNVERIGYINQNREKFGVVDNCLVTQGIAPNICAELPNPDCIFVGGSSGALHELLEFSWSKLGCGGKLVVSAVTADSKVVINQWLQNADALNARADWVEVSVRKTIPTGSIRDLAPVQILSLTKNSGLSS